jgi:hypothetical protein
LLILAGCHKERVDLSGYPELAGDFDWTYSQMSSTKIVTRDDTGDAYAFRLKENGKVLLYKNGAISHKGQVYSVEQAGDHLVISMSMKRGKSVSMNYKNGQLYSYSAEFPYAAIINVFQKKYHDDQNTPFHSRAVLSCCSLQKRQDVYA